MIETQIAAENEMSKLATPTCEEIACPICGDCNCGGECDHGPETETETRFWSPKQSWKNWYGKSRMLANLRKEKSTAEKLEASRALFSYLDGKRYS